MLASNAPHGLQAVVGAIALGLLLLGLVSLVRMAWRYFHQNEPMESGGSYGRQFFSRRKDD